jgi:tRNA A-37 threonylcarbamoyl transferase component Bud32
MAVRRMLVAGRYRLHEPVGTGGMGRVWMARDEMLDRDVAVKEFVPPEWMADAERDRLRDRTLREARSAARLNHPHVVRIYDVVHADDRPWIVMEYVASRSLHQVIVEDGPLSPVAAAKVGLRVLDALTAAHEAGVLHRDVKPHNVLIGHDGRVVLTDFGLATFVDDGTVTGPGLIVGSPQYVSPERARDGASTVESDLWSLGATLYAMVEGRSPYARENAMATLMALATDDPDPTELAGPLTPVLTGLLRHEPSTRLTAPEIEAALRHVVAGGPVPGETTTGGVTPVQRRPPGSWSEADRHRPGPSLPAGQRVGRRVAGRATVPAQRTSEDDRDEPAELPVPVAADAIAGPPNPLATPPRERVESARVGTERRVIDRVAIPAPAVEEAEVEAERKVEAGEPAPVPAPTTRRPRLGPAVAGVLLVAVLGGGGLAAGWWSDRGEPDAGALPTTTASPSAVTTAGSGSGGAAAGFSPSVCGRPTGQNVVRTPLPGALRTGPDNGLALVAGWSYHRDETGFVVAVPDGWTYERIGTTVCFADPRGVRVLSIDTARKPTADPVVACRREAQRLVGTGALPGYEELGIARVPYLTKAADWQFRFDDAQGDRMRAATRWFTAGGKAFALGWVTAEFDWQVNRSNLDMILSSFSSPTASKGTVTTR